MAAIAFLCNSSCAYLIHGTSDEINIQSSNPKAELYLDDQPIGIGSAMAIVHRDKTYTIQAKAAGCETRTVQTGDRFDPISLLGLIIDFGIVSILIIDMAITGAAWKTYPRTYIVNPVCPPPEIPAPAALPAAPPVR